MLGFVLFCTTHLVGVFGNHFVVRVGHIGAPHHERLVVERSRAHVPFLRRLFAAADADADVDADADADGTKRV